MFSFHHCGGCGLRCEGSCISGTCKPAELILDWGVEQFVANAKQGFALVGSDDSTERVFRVDLNSGAAEVIADGLEPWASLLLGADRLFVAYSDRVLSMAFDGSVRSVESFVPETLGATQAGVYYTESDSMKPASEQASLWFRATGASAFELLLQSGACPILGSSRDSVLVARKQNGQEELVLVDGKEMRSLGLPPDEPSSALQLVEDGVVFLVVSQASPSGYEVLWLSLDDEPRRFAVEPSLAQSNFVLAPGGVGLMLRDRSNTFVRLFSQSSLDDIPLGISNNSKLAYVDERYLWYSWEGAANDLSRFVRARQFELSDAIPSE